MVERKQINPAKCFYKTNSQGGRYKYCITNEKDYNKYDRLKPTKNNDKVDRLSLEEELEKQLKLLADDRNRNKRLEEDLERIQKKDTTKKESNKFKGMSRGILKQEEEKIRKRLKKLQKQLKTAPLETELDNEGGLKFLGESELRKKIKTLKKKQKQIIKLLD